MAKIKLPDGRVVVAPDGLSPEEYGSIADEVMGGQVEQPKSGLSQKIDKLRTKFNLQPYPGTENQDMSFKGNIIDPTKYMGEGLVENALNIIKKISSLNPITNKFDKTHPTKAGPISKYLDPETWAQMRLQKGQEMQGKAGEWITKQIPFEKLGTAGLAKVGINLADQPDTSKMTDQGEKMWTDQKNVLKRGTTGLLRVLQNVATPENAVLASGLGALSKAGAVGNAAEKGIAATFIPGMAGSAYEKIKTGLQSDDPKVRDESIFEGILYGLAGYGLTKHVAGGKGGAKVSEKTGMTNAQLLKDLDIIQQQKEAVANFSGAREKNWNIPESDIARIDQARTQEAVDTFKGARGKNWNIPESETNRLTDIETRVSAENRARIDPEIRALTPGLRARLPLLSERSSVPTDLKGKVVVVSPEGKVTSIVPGSQVRTSSVEPNKVTVIPTRKMQPLPPRGKMVTIGGKREVPALSTEQVQQMMARPPVKGVTEVVPKTEAFPEINKGQIVSSTPRYTPTGKIQLRPPRVSTWKLLRDSLKNERGAVGDLGNKAQNIAKQELAQRVREYAKLNEIELDEAIRRVVEKPEVLDEMPTPKRLGLKPVGGKPVKTPETTTGTDTKAYSDAMTRFETFNKDYAATARKAEVFERAKEDGTIDRDADFTTTPEYAAFSTKYPDILFEKTATFKNKNYELENFKRDLYVSEMKRSGIDIKPHIDWAARAPIARERTNLMDKAAMIYKKTQIEPVKNSVFTTETGISKRTWIMEPQSKAFEKIFKKNKRVGLTPEQTYDALQYVISEKPLEPVHFDPRARKTGEYDVPEYKGAVPTEAQMNYLTELHREMDKMFLASGRENYTKGYVPRITRVPEHFYSGQNSIIDPSIYRKRSGKDVPVEKNIKKVVNAYVRKWATDMTPEIKQGLAQAQVAKWQLESRGYTDLAEEFSEHFDNAFNFKKPSDIGKVDLSKITADMSLRELKKELQRQGLERDGVDNFIREMNNQFVHSKMGFNLYNMIAQTLQPWTSGAAELGFFRVLRDMTFSKLSKADKMLMDSVEPQLREKHFNPLEVPEEMPKSGTVGKVLKAPAVPVMKVLDIVDMAGRRGTFLSGYKQYLGAKDVSKIMADLTEMERSRVIDTEKLYNDKAVGRLEAAKEYGIIRSRRVMNRMNALDKPRAYREGLGRHSFFTTFFRGETAKILRDYANVPAELKGIVQRFSKGKEYYKGTTHMRMSLKRLWYPLVLGQIFAAATGDKKWMWYFLPHAGLIRAFDTSLGAPQALAEAVVGNYGKPSARQAIKGIAGATALTNIPVKLGVFDKNSEETSSSTRGQQRGGQRGR